jgi:lipoyl synthase
MSNFAPIRPEHYKARFRFSEKYHMIDRFHHERGLNSVCRSAACPNQGECWSRGTATFMILGNICTRGCGFCNIAKGVPISPDTQEPHKIALAIKELELKYAVITSVTRDDLDDGGASVFAQMTHEIKQNTPKCSIELLIPDLQGNIDALTIILESGPDILGHNIETVSRLYPLVRKGASYSRSLKLLSDTKVISPGIKSKSSLMLGLGESIVEVIQVLKDLRNVGCDILALGQYLSPTKDHFPVSRYLKYAEFAELKLIALELGFYHVEAGPLVRSSYHAEKILLTKDSQSYETY